jgi:hypothetical protein
MLGEDEKSVHTEKSPSDTNFLVKRLIIARLAHSTLTLTCHSPHKRVTQAIGGEHMSVDKCQCEAKLHNPSCNQK